MVFLLVQICTHFHPGLSPLPSCEWAEVLSWVLPPSSLSDSAVHQTFLPTSLLCGMWSGWFPSHRPPLFPKDNTTRVGVCSLVLLSKINTAVPTSRSLQGQEKAEAACLGWCLVTIVGVSGGFLLVGARVAVNKLWVFSPPVSTFSPLALSSGGRVKPPPQLVMRCFSAGGTQSPTFY